MSRRCDIGGNVTAKNKKTGEEVRAEKIPIKEIGRKNFVNKFIKVFHELNKIYKKKNKTYLWLDEKNIANGLQFNGSTSYIFDQSIDDIELVKYKTHAGDLDIIVPEGLKSEVWHMLDKLEGQEIIKGVKYVGCNKGSVSEIADQINCVFVVDFGKGLVVPCQVDFEFLPMEADNTTPTEWAKFSHSSSFVDAKAGVKAVHHKFLIQSIVGGASARADIAVATPASTPDNIKVSKAADEQIPRMLKFSVGRGIRYAYEPMMDENGDIIEIDGKKIYKKIVSATDDYVTIVREIYKLVFGDLADNPDDVKKFGSFVGVMDLMAKYLDKDQIKLTHDRYRDKLFRPRVAQIIERGNAEADYGVKISGYNLFCKKFGVTPDTKTIDKYYDTFKDNKNESMFRIALERIV